MVARSAAGRARPWGLVLLLALLAVLVTPGAASAAPAGLTPGHGTVVPLVDCVQVRDGGAITAVLGYRNSGTATEHLSGAENVVTPARLDGTQPTTFRSGTYHGVVALQVDGGEVSWTLDGTTVVVSAASPACPAADSLPADGNGLGATMVLLAAGVIAVFAVLRAGRRSSSRVPTP